MVALIPGTWPMVGWVMLIFGVAIAAAAIFSDQPSATINEVAPEPVEPEPDVYVVFDEDLSAVPDAALGIYNGGPGAVHDVQISAMKNVGKLMTFEIVPNIEDGGIRKPWFQIYGQDGRISDHLRTVESFLAGRRFPRDFGRFLHDRIVGTWSREGDFEDIVIPFTVKFRMLGGRSGTRSHRLIFEPGTRRAYVRANPRFYVTPEK